MIIVYLYDGSGPIAQIMGVSDCNISHKLSDISTASFSLSNESEYCTSQYIRLYLRVKIANMTDTGETFVFDGVIRGIEGDQSSVTIMLESLEHMLDRRILASDTSHGGSVASLVEYLVGVANTAGPTGITSVSCDITSIITKEYKQGDTVLSALKDLASAGYEFFVRDGVLIFGTLAGVDRTQNNDDYMEYRYDSAEPSGRNIDAVKISIDGKEITNGVLANANGYNYVADSVSIAEYGLLQSAISVSGDPIASAQGYLNTHKNPTVELEVTLSVSEEYKTNVGDKVRLSVDIGNDIIRYDGSVRVVSRTETYGDLSTVQLGLSTTRIRTKNIIEQVSDLISEQKKQALY